MKQEYQIISADSHLELSADRFVDRMPTKFRDRAPRRIKLEHGGDAHVIEGRQLIVEPIRHQPSIMQRSSNVFGHLSSEIAEELPPGEFHEWPYGGSFDTNPGTGSPEQRLREQDIDGIDAEVLFPGTQGAKFWRGIKSDTVFKAVVRAYNEHVAQDYCSVAPDRLIGLGLLPNTGAQDAIDEMENCARMGMKGVTLISFPGGKTYPTPDDDLFWEAALDMNMPIAVHVQFHQEGTFWRYDKQPALEGHGGSSDPIGKLAGIGQKGGREATRLIFSGTFDRFPRLRIFFAENQIGWIPNWLEQFDVQWDKWRPWAEGLFGVKSLERLPSEYIKEHCLWGFQNNPIGVRMRHDIGIDNILWATDFPHQESDWPHSRETIEKSFVGVPEEERYQIIAGNAIRFFHLDEL